MADDLSLLWHLRAENTQAKAAIADTRAAVASLRQTLGPEFNQTVSLTNKTFSQLSDNLNLFVGQRIPLVGGAFLRVTENLRNLTSESSKNDKALTSVANSIQSIATESGKSVPQITAFLAKFVQIEGQAARDKSAIDFFGASLGAKLIPQLEKTGAEFAAVSEEAATTGSAMAGLAGPIGIAVVALTAAAIAAAALAREIFNLAKASADYQGKLFDLSQQTGVSVETLSALEVVARTTGSSVERLTQSLVIFQRKLEESEDPKSKAAESFKKLGVEVSDTETTLRATIAALAKMPEGYQQTALAQEVFGRSGKAFLAIAKESNGDIDEITRRLEKLGLVSTADAKLADEFNDQLVILDVQLRGLGAKAIPVVLAALRDLSKFLEDNRIIFLALQAAVSGLAAAITGPLHAALLVLRTSVALAKAELKPAAEVLERIKAAIEFIAGHPVTLPSFGSNAAPAPVAAPPAPGLPKQKTFTKELEEEIDARRRLQGVLNLEFEQRKLQAKESIALAQREFEAGRSSREDLLQATIAGNRKITQAEIEQLKVERGIRLAEIGLAKDDIDKRTQLSLQILAIDSQIATKQSELRTTQKDLTAKSRLEEQKDELAHQQRLVEIRTQAGQRDIQRIKDEIARGITAREDGLNRIELLENNALQARAVLLKEELRLVGFGPDRQSVLDKIAALENDRTELERTQAERRKAITREEFETNRTILLNEADTLLRLGQIGDEARIASLKALADARVRTEEQTAKDILKIRLNAIDREADAIRARQTAAKSIEDPNERARVQADLINQLKINAAERTAIQEQGNRDIDEARKKDLENERRYAAQLKDIRERILGIERDIAEEGIRLLSIHFASRRDIIKAQLQLDIDDENARHRQAEETIRNLEQENRESNRTAEEKLEAEREINLLREAEAERHRLALQGIKDQGQRDEEDADPLGRLTLDTERLKQFSVELENTIVPLNEILAKSFHQVADAIGQTVANWVLLGTTGPAVMRKILAQALASVAAEAAVNAIKELALGFATLFFNPAESAAHFTAAGLWGSIAGVSAAVGRGVAGDLFKQPSSGASGNSSSGGTGEVNPLTLQRNPGTPPQPKITIVMHGEAAAMFDYKVKRVISDDYRSGGETREMFNNDGGIAR